MVSEVEVTTNVEEPGGSFAFFEQNFRWGEREVRSVPIEHPLVHAWRVRNTDMTSAAYGSRAGWDTLKYA